MPWSYHNGEEKCPKGGGGGTHTSEHAKPEKEKVWENYRTKGTGEHITVKGQCEYTIFPIKQQKGRGSKGGVNKILNARGTIMDIFKGIFNTTGEGGISISSGKQYLEEGINPGQEKGATEYKKKNKALPQKRQRRRMEWKSKRKKKKIRAYIKKGARGVAIKQPLLPRPTTGRGQYKGKKKKTGGKPKTPTASRSGELRSEYIQTQKKRNHN